MTLDLFNGQCYYRFQILKEWNNFPVVDLNLPSFGPQRKFYFVLQTLPQNLFLYPFPRIYSYHHGLNLCHFHHLQSYLVVSSMFIESPFIEFSKYLPETYVKSDSFMFWTFPCKSDFFLFFSFITNYSPVLWVSHLLPVLSDLVTLDHSTLPSCVCTSTTLCLCSFFSAYEIISSYLLLKFYTFFCNTFSDSAYWNQFHSFLIPGRTERIQCILV